MRLLRGDAFALVSLLVLLTLVGCECGPGTTCRSDAECAAGSRCDLAAGSPGVCRLAPADDAGVDAGTPRGALAPAELSFGPVDCRGSATLTATLTNEGDAELSWAAGTSGAGFSVSPASGAVAPGASATLTVTASIGATVAAGANLSGTLEVTANDGAGPRRVPLTASARGATLTLSPPVASFGVRPVNTPAPFLPMTLTNTGNATATLRFTQPADTQFSLRWGGGTETIALAPGATAAGLEAGFTPSGITPASDSAAIAVEGAVCGTSVSAVPMTGQGTNGSVTLDTTELFFGTNGLVDCGATSPGRTVTLGNAGNAAFAWTATLGRGGASPFTVSPASGTVPAGATVTLTLTSAGVPPEADTTEGAFGDVLSIVTDVANDVTHRVSLRQTARGARLRLAPADLDFGQVPVQTSSRAPFSVVNDGNTSPEVALTVDNPLFSLDPAGPVVAAAGASVALHAVFAPDASVQLETGLVALSLDAGEVLCAPLPGALTLRGQGSSGSVGFSPAALDWGGVDCGSTAAPRTVTFRNTGNQAYTVSATLGRDAGATFDLTLAPATGVVEPDGGTLVITVAPRPVPQTSAVTPNLYGDVLTVTTDVPNDTPHDIPLRLTARGSIFAISTGSLDFGSVPRGATATSQFTLSNSGNAPGALVFTPGQPSIFSLPANAQVNGNAVSPQVGTFSPAAAASYSDTATIAPASGTVLCQPLPRTSLALAGVGTAANVLLLSASSLSFGLVPCGTTAPAQTVTITNNSGQALAMTYALGAGGASPYTVSGPATISAGASGTVTVSPKMIPTTSSTAPDAFADTLAITGAGGPVNETQTVQLHQTAQGAVLFLNPTALAFNATLGGSQSKTFTVNNSGNLAAPYTLSVGGTNPGNFSVMPTAATASAGGSVSHTATYTAPALGGSRSGTITVATSVTLCAPAPAPLPLAGSN